MCGPANRCGPRKKPPGRDAGRLSHAAAGPAPPVPPHLGAMLMQLGLRGVNAARSRSPPPRGPEILRDLSHITACSTRRRQERPAAEGRKTEPPARIHRSARDLRTASPRDLLVRRSSELSDSVIPGRALARTRNLEIPGLVLMHHPGMTTDEKTDPIHF
jgi:hypothetical protein